MYLFSNNSIFKIVIQSVQMSWKEYVSLDPDQELIYMYVCICIYFFLSKKDIGFSVSISGFNPCFGTY